MTEPRGVGEVSPRLWLMGGWRLVADGAEVALGRREQRLVALLGLRGPRSRAEVARTLWPASTDANALASLRRAVGRTHQRCPGVIMADRETIDLGTGVGVDVRNLRRAAATAEGPTTGVAARALLDALRGDELLPEWYDDWVVAEREQLAQLRVTALERVAIEALEVGHLTLAIDAARAASDLEPLREPVREVVIRAHLVRGEPGPAVREFHQYSDVLREELGAVPSRRIVALVEPVLRNRGDDPVGEGRTVPRPLLAARRGLVAWVVALAGLVLLTASLAIALAGPGPERDDLGGRTGARSGFVAPAGALPDPSPQPERQVAVRPLDAAARRAVFAVRALPSPALVRLVLRGPAGARVARSLLVRGPDGRRVVVGGLRPGRYEWWATAAAATRVSGVVRVRAGQPTRDVPLRVVSVAGPRASSPAPTTTAPSPTPAWVPSPSSTPTYSPPPSYSPTQSPTQSPAPSPAPTPVPGPTSEPTPSQPTPTEPTDPGTVSPTPVG
jgi:DNA-binding SARP family transcriptional activator